ncbi:MAG TPA: pitrilysin family protein [Cyclobacteriaceae bacterium]|nr:pitrilysin family protein [Cyclobacteriaceae bacterium]
MTLDRSRAPEFKIPEKITHVKPIKRVLTNGVPLFFIHTPHIDAVKIEVITAANNGLLMTDKALVPFFTLHMLLEGTKSLKSEQIDNFFDHYASEVDVVSNFEQSGLSLLTTKKHFSQVLPLFRSLFTEAIFPEKELAKRKSQKELSISLNREQNGARANQLYRKGLFGKDHPYGFIAEEADVKRINREDLDHFYRHGFLVNPEIFVTGNLQESDLDAIEELFRDLHVVQGDDPLPFFEKPVDKRIFEPNEKSVQSSIRLGQHLIPKSHPDYQALTVFNTILGGYFGSRLIKNIREEKGHTYGIYSSIGSLNLSDYWMVMADVQQGFSEEVINEVYKEIDTLKNTPIDLSEQEVVRNYMIGNLLSSFSSPFDLMTRFKNVHQHGLDYRFYEEQLDFVKTFTPEDIMDIGTRYFNRENIFEVVVGTT